MWDKITLFQFQQIDSINKKNIDELDKLLFTTCVLFNKTEFELDNMPLVKVDKLIGKVKETFEKELQPLAAKRIGKYFVNYSLANLTLGQYIELCHFLKKDTLHNAQYVLASITHLPFYKNNSGEHRKKSDYFLHKPIKTVMGSIALFIKNFIAFNNEYKLLFNNENVEAGEKKQEHSFIKNFGWVFSATCIADHEKISLDAAFSLPIRQALNDLIFIKEKQSYQDLQLKMNSNGSR